jgi:hypothetical protein
MAAEASDVLGGSIEPETAKFPLPLGEELGMAAGSDEVLGGGIELDAEKFPPTRAAESRVAAEAIVDMEFCRLAAVLLIELAAASLFVTSEPAVCLGIQS